MDTYTSIENDLNYELFLAEQELIRNIALLENKSRHITEAAEIQSLNESVADIIKQYITKVTNAIIAAWNKFKSIVVKSEITQMINNGKKFLNSGFRMLVPKDFEVPDLNKWESARQYIDTTFEANPFTVDNYDRWKREGYLDSEVNFLGKTYTNMSNYAVGEGTPVEQIHRYVFGEQRQGRDVIMTSEIVQVHSDWLLKYPDQINAISKNMDTVNASNRNIDQMLNTILQGKNESFLGYHMLDMLLEDVANPPATINTNTQPSTSGNSNGGQSNNNSDNQFRAADGQAQNGKDPKKVAEDRKNIVTYYKACTTILSMEMKICNQCRSASEKIVKNYIRLQQSGGTNEQPQQQQQNAPAQAGLPQIS